LKIFEPTTVFTDYILAAETFVLGTLLLRENSALQQSSIRLLAFAFITTGIAALSGGTAHALGTTSGPIWKVTVYAIGVTSLLMLGAGVFSSITGMSRTILLTLAVAQFLMYAVWMAGHDDFKYVIYDYAPAMVVVLLLQASQLFLHGSAAAPWIIGGILVSFGAAAIQQSGFTLHRNFNHNDLYHVIQMGAMLLLYRGGSLLRDR
jgi:hypothetical protein